MHECMDNDNANHMNIHCTGSIANNEEPSLWNGIRFAIGIQIGLKVSPGRIGDKRREGCRVGGDGGMVRVRKKACTQERRKLIQRGDISGGRSPQ